ncbi:MAG: hypothetical protein JOZ81_16400 [Chloroflexi bacterium]|nr:hypothetical protein [Chloroflexota bacterium]
MEHDSLRKTTSDSVDAPYRFGRPIVYLAPHELARVMILRSRLGDSQAARIARAAGITPAVHHHTTEEKDA